MGAPVKPGVVVVGNGAAGTLVVINLLRSAARRRRRMCVHWVGDGPPGRGVAYSTAQPWHRLNVASDHMGRGDGVPGFPAWLAANGAGGEDFASRRDFGSYLADTLTETRRAATGLVVVKEIGARAVALSTDGRCVSIELDDGGRVVADRAVLALGVASPAPPPGATAAALAHPGLVADPWSGALDEVRHGHDAVLIGTGLTMVDVALSLSRQVPGLRMHAVSRSGLTPRAHAPAGADPTPPVARPRPGLALEELLTEVGGSLAEAGTRWRDVIDGLRPVTQDLWRALSPADRERFLREHSRRWEVHRHRMAPAVAEEFHGLLDAGTLRISASPVRSIDVVDRHLRVGFAEDDRQVDWVVNCTGPSDDVTASDDPFVVSLLRGGHARPHPLGLGFDTAARGALVTAAGASSRLFTLGAPRRGELYETTAIPEISDQARELADILLHRVTGDPE